MGLKRLASGFGFGCSVGWVDGWLMSADVLGWGRCNSSRPWTDKTCGTTAKSLAAKLPGRRRHRIRLAIDPTDTPLAFDHLGRRRCKAPAKQPHHRDCPGIGPPQGWQSTGLGKRQPVQYSASARAIPMPGLSLGNVLASGQRCGECPGFCARASLRMPGQWRPSAVCPRWTRAGFPVQRPLGPPSGGEGVHPPTPFKRRGRTPSVSAKYRGAGEARLT